MLGRPVFGRKRHAPESGSRYDKLQAYFGLAATHRNEKHDMALLFLFRLVVPHMDDAAAGDARLKQNQRPVRVNGESFREFLEVLALGVHSSKTQGDVHQHALAAASRPRIRICAWNLSHATSHLQLYAG